MNNTLSYSSHCQSEWICTELVSNSTLWRADGCWFLWCYRSKPRNREVRNSILAPQVHGRGVSTGSMSEKEAPWKSQGKMLVKMEVRMQSTRTNHNHWNPLQWLSEDTKNWEFPLPHDLGTASARPIYLPACAPPAEPKSRGEIESYPFPNLAMGIGSYIFTSFSYSHFCGGRSVSVTDSRCQSRIIFLMFA